MAPKQNAIKYVPKQTEFQDLPELALSKIVKFVVKGSNANAKLVTHVSKQLQTMAHESRTTATFDVDAFLRTHAPTGRETNAQVENAALEYMKKLKSLKRIIFRFSSFTVYDARQKLLAALLKSLPSRVIGVAVAIQAPAGFNRDVHQHILTQILGALGQQTRLKEFAFKTKTGGPLVLDGLLDHRDTLERLRIDTVGGNLAFRQGTPVSAFPRLSHVRTGYYYHQGETDRFLKHVLSGALERLHIASMLVEESMDFVQEIIRSTGTPFPNLKSLTMAVGGDERQHMALLNRFTSLKELSIKVIYDHASSLKNEYDMRALRLPQLQRLDLTFTYTPPDQSHLLLSQSIPQVTISQAPFKAKLFNDSTFDKTWNKWNF